MCWCVQGFSLRTLQHLVLDEADRILSLDFEEDIDKILKACAAFGASNSSVWAVQATPFC